MTHVTLHKQTLDLTALDAEENDLYRRAAEDYCNKPLDWATFKLTWLRAVVTLYDGRQMPRYESVTRPLYRSIQDFGSRLMVEAEKATCSTTS